jgi:hypothetical protein
VRSRVTVRGQHVIPNVILEDLGHQGVDRASAGGQRVQRALTIDVLVDELFDRTDVQGRPSGRPQCSGMSAPSTGGAGP